MELKDYTDLAQSRALAEILPHNTADHIYECFTITKAKDVPKETLYKHNGNIPFQFCSGIGIPCWSLAALIGIIPNVSLHNFTDGTWTAMVEYNGKMVYANKNNPLDACYEMIVKLHEQKLL